MALPERLYNLDLFPSNMQVLMQQWRDNAVVTAPKFRYLNDNELAGRGLSPIVTPGGSRWVLTEDGHIAVLKKDLLTYLDRTQTHTAAREKICTDLAHHVGLLTPPAQIWEIEGNYFSASYRIFPDSFDSPSDEILRADDSVPALAVFDQWPQQMDRGRDNILAGHPQPGSPLMLAYHDYSLSLNNETNVLPFLYHPKRSVASKNLSPQIVHYIGNAVQDSPSAQKMMGNIQATTDSQIDYYIDRLPNAIFRLETDLKQKIGTILKSRRDRIRTIVRRAAMQADFV